MLETDNDFVETNATLVEPRAELARTEEPAAPAQDSFLLGRLLGMADVYQSNNAIRHALELYLRLIDEAPGSSAAQQARQRILDIATRYEKEGKLHQARALYERLLGDSLA